MELSICLNYITEHSDAGRPLDVFSAASACRAAGFEYFDYSPDFLSDDWEARAHRDKEIFDGLGVSVEQTHAPFNRYGQFDEKMFPTYYKRLFEASKILGAKYVVVHADEYRTKDRYDADEILDYECRRLTPYVEFAKENGMTVAVENVFEDKIARSPQIDGKSRFTARIDELLAVIERFSSPTVRCCWDFGHAKCAFGKDGMTDALRKVGKHVVCTHVHDNYYDRDLHLVPYQGDADWKQNMTCLKNVGYSGKLSFEFAYGNIPRDLLTAWLEYVFKTGKYLAGIFDGNR